MSYCIKYMSRQSVIRGLKQSINVFCVRKAADPCLQTLVLGDRSWGMQVHCTLNLRWQ